MLELDRSPTEEEGRKRKHVHAQRGYLRTWMVKYQASTMPTKTTVKKITQTNPLEDSLVIELFLMLYCYFCTNPLEDT